MKKTNISKTMTREAALVYTRARWDELVPKVKNWLSVECAKITAKGGYFKGVWFKAYKPETAKDCYAKLVAAQKILKSAYLEAELDFFKRASEYFNAPAPKQAHTTPAKQERKAAPKRKASKAERVQTAYMRVAKAVRAGTLKTDGKSLYYKTNGAYNDCARLVDAIGLPATVDYIAGKM